VSRAVYGRGPVAELIRSRPQSIVVLYVQRQDDELAVLAGQRKVDVELRRKGELALLAGQGAVHQGVVAIAGELQYADLHDVMEAERSEPALLVALDGVQDPRNFGAIVRSAHVLGAHAVIVPRDRAARVTPVVTKASAGATECVPIVQVTNLVRALEELKQRDFWIAGIASHPGARPLWELDATSPLCLVLGSEGKGMRPLVAKTCDFHFEIPMAGQGVGSLNVSVAAATALYEVRRARHQ